MSHTQQPNPLQPPPLWQKVLRYYRQKFQRELKEVEEETAVLEAEMKELQQDQQKTLKKDISSH